MPLMVREVHLALRDAEDARTAGAALVEWRVDGFFDGLLETEQLLKRLVAESPLPCIVTCRIAAEGGEYEGSEEDRARLYESLVRLRVPPRFIDLELRSAESPEFAAFLAAIHQPASPGALATSLILSIHDFTGRPADLSRRLVRLAGMDPSAVRKVAFLARSVRDNLELFDLMVDGAAPTIAVAMGEHGVMSRVLAPKFGGLVTYASLGGGTETAPGQLTVKQLRRLYRFDAISRRTAVHGIIGWPVAHSLSPAVHNGVFAERGADAVYLPLPVAPGYEPFKATILSLLVQVGLDFTGCSVTAPHKENLVRLARSMDGWTLDELSSVCGAANTLTVKRSRGGEMTTVEVTNTDGPAAAEILEQVIGPLRGKNVAVLGAGGLARSVAAAAVLRGVHVRVANRTAERAAALARDLEPAIRLGGSLAAVASDELVEGSTDALVNCTPASGEAEGSPLSGADHPLSMVKRLAQVNPRAVFMETGYVPRGTRALAVAKGAGLRTIDGLELFIAQAELQAAGWNAVAVPAGLARKLAEAALSGAGPMSAGDGAYAL